MDKVKGRSDDMLKIRGVNVFPSQIESVLIGTEQIGANYQLVVRREDFQIHLKSALSLLTHLCLRATAKSSGFRRR